VVGFQVFISKIFFLKDSSEEQSKSRGQKAAKTKGSKTERNGGKNSVEEGGGEEEEEEEQSDSDEFLKRKRKKSRMVREDEGVEKNENALGYEEAQLVLDPSKPDDAELLKLTKKKYPCSQEELNGGWREISALEFFHRDHLEDEDNVVAKFNDKSTNKEEYIRLSIESKESKLRALGEQKKLVYYYYAYLVSSSMESLASLVTIVAKVGRPRGSSAQHSVIIWRYLTIILEAAAL
jgi:hypothetical protein